jgi:hypothetical protein
MNAGESLPIGIQADKDIKGNVVFYARFENEEVWYNATGSWNRMHEIQPKEKGKRKIPNVPPVNPGNRA